MSGVYAAQADLVVGDAAGVEVGVELGELVDELEEVEDDCVVEESLDDEPPSPDAFSDFSVLEVPESSDVPDGVVLEVLPRLSFL